MPGHVDAKLEALGIVLPAVPTPIASFVPYRVTQGLVFLAGQTCEQDGRMVSTGRVGVEVEPEDARRAARVCALNLLAALRQACGGDLDRVSRCVRVGGFVQAASGFPGVPQVIDGASELFVALWGEDGRHARTSVGVATLPQNAAVEVDAIFELRGAPVNLALRGITKRFGANTAVDAVDLDIRGGEVLALLGENGAGKSTLVKVAYGFHEPDSGTIEIDGRPARIDGPRAARAAGIGMVFQQFSLLPALTVAENLMLAWPRAPRWLPAWARAWREVVRRLAEIAPEIDPRTPAARLTVGQKQLVEIAKVLNLGARVVILDEPTSVLARPEAERLWREVRALASAGCGVVLITHKLEDVTACADRVAVMRAGRLAGETHDVHDQRRIVNWMMGEAPPPVARRTSVTQGPLRLEARALAAEDRGARITDLSLEVARGEIVGVAGVTGNGQELLGRLLAGVTAPRQGHVLLDGRDVGGRAEAAHANIAYLPEQPALNGCARELSQLVNLEILEVRRLAFVPRWGQARARAAGLLERFDVRPRDLDLPAGALSGGNLQKLVSARELSRTPGLVVACYPTMGLDLAAAAAIVGHLLDCAAAGAAVVWISEDLDVLLEHADRIAVLQGGRLQGPVPTAQATRQALGAWMTGAAA